MENPTSRINELYKIIKQMNEEIGNIKFAIDCMNPELLAKKETSLVQPKTKPPVKTVKSKAKKVEKVNVAKVVKATKANMKGKDFAQPEIEASDEEEENFSDFEPEIKTLELKY